MRRFWEIEDREDPERMGISVEDQQVLGLWETKQVKIGNHYQLPIPFRGDTPLMLNNMQMVLRCLMGLRTRLSRDEALRDRYVKEMKELISRGYTEKVSLEGCSLGKTWYFPHHLVFNPNKPEKNTHRFLLCCPIRGSRAGKASHART